MKLRRIATPKRIGVAILRSLGILIACFSLMTGFARAECVGANLLPELRANDPAGIEAMFARADAVPNANGRLWRVDKPGSTPSHLFGTFHSGEALGTVTPAIWALLEASRIAIFEVELAEQEAMEARMASDPSFVFDLEGKGVLSVMTEEQAATFTEALTLRGMDVRAADRMQPWLLAAILSFPPCHLRAMSSGDQALDSVLAQRAQGLGISEAGLETYEVALESLQSVPKEMLITALTGVPELLDREEDVFRTNHHLYETGQIQAINELGIYLTERFRPDIDARGINVAMMTELLDVRNLGWMPRLEAELNKGNAFVAVGALHLPGEVGLVELLRAKGFTVTRLDN